MARKHQLQRLGVLLEGCSGQEEGSSCSVRECCRSVAVARKLQQLQRPGVLQECLGGQEAAVAASGSESGTTAAAVAASGSVAGAVEEARVG